MTLTALSLTLTLVMYSWPLRAESSQNEMQMLKTDAYSQQRENSPYRSKRDDNSASRNHISEMLANIENAFRFLEEQQPEAAARERLLIEDLQRIRKNEQVNRPPFTQHNFIRFGKRFDANTETNSLSSKFDSSQDGDISTKDLGAVLNRPWSQISDEQRSKLAFGESGYPDLASVKAIPRKRQFHNFVRIGKRHYQVTNPHQLEAADDSASANEEVENSLGKRAYSNFVRFG